MVHGQCSKTVLCKISVNVFAMFAMFCYVNYVWLHNGFKSIFFHLYYEPLFVCVCVWSLGLWKVVAKFHSNPQQSYSAEFEVKEYGEFYYIWTDI